MLRDRIYLGGIVHKEKHYPGEHPQIISRVNGVLSVTYAVAERAVTSEPVSE
jgi:hypothetical protein